MSQAFSHGASWRDRLRAGATEETREQSEADAARLLASARGRAQIKPPPAAARAAAALMRLIGKENVQSLGLSDLKRRWAEIAGQPFAGKTEPEKLAGGVLTLAASSALAPLLQQQAPLLIERLRLAGAKITDIRIAHRAARPRAQGNLKPLKRALDPTEEAALARELDEIADPKLRSALLSLGKAVRQG